MAEKLKLPFPVLSDPEHKVIEAYDVYDPQGKISRAAVFIVDKKGVVRWVNVSEDYKVRPLNAVLLDELKKLP